MDAECLARENKRLGRLLKEAKLRLSQACIEDIDYPARRELDKAVVRQLASCRWVHEAPERDRHGDDRDGEDLRRLRARAAGLPQGLLSRLSTGAHPASSMSSPCHARTAATCCLLAKLARVDVLVIDDWGLTAAGEQERRDFFEILEDRYGNRSTIMTSQLPPKTWHAHLADQTLADAILDRILHNAHRLVLKGPSRRKPEKETEAE